jgi:hypothetical protein
MKRVIIGNMASYFICITGERSTSAFDEKILTDICKLVESDKVEFIFGDCTGVDTAALRACKLLGIKYKMYVADWSNLGKMTGPVRNKQMVDYLVDKKSAESYIGLSDNLHTTIQVWAYHTDYKKSKGTVNTIKLADKAGIYVTKN